MNFYSKVQYSLILGWFDFKIIFCTFVSQDLVDIFVPCCSAVSQGLPYSGSTRAAVDVNTRGVCCVVLWRRCRDMG